MIKVLLVALSSIVVASAQPAGAKTNLLPSDADKAWQEIEAAGKAPPTPKEWGNQPPTEEQRKEFEKFLGEQSLIVAEKAREFQKKFPDHGKVAEAKTREEYYTKQAVRYGNSKAIEQTEASLSEADKIELKLNEAHRRAMEKRAQGVPAVVKEFEVGIREVMKAYPKSPVPWQALMVVANNGDQETQKRVLAEIADSKVADEETVGRAKGMLKALGSIGRPLELSFTALDGRNVDVQKLKGKVVLIDFWATWCGPCMVGMPEVVELYEKLHDKGFEIVGISLDKNQKSLQSVLDQYKIAWPQYFDGKGWGNKFVIEYNISAIPTMWLVDKAGKLRTMQGREDLEKQVQDLLNEKI